MTLSLKLASKDGVPDELSQFLKPDGAGFLLECPEGYGIDNVAGLKAKRDQLLSETRQLKVAQKAFEGLDPEQTRQALEELQQFKTQPQGGGFKAVEEARKQLEAQYGKKLADMEASLRKASEDRRRHLLQSAEQEALRAAESRPLPGLEYVIRERLRVVEDGDKLTVAVIDPKTGEERYSSNSSQVFMSPVELIRELHGDTKAWGHLFEGSGKQGAGVTGQRVAQAQSNPFDPRTANLHEQMRLFKEEPERAAALKAQAAAAQKG